MMRKAKGKISALRICRDLWIWLRENPFQPKYMWPGWDCRGGNVKECIMGCPCCEYLKVKDVKDCRGCPLNGYAWKDNPFSPCVREGSPYEAWANAHCNYPTPPNTAKKAALKMVRACERALRANGAKVETYRRK